MPTILVVDDLATDRRLVGQLLQKQRDLTVEFAPNGAKGLERMQRAPAPEVVVTDLKMPEMDGLQLLNNIKQQFRHVPVVLMTSAGSEEIAAQALQQGASSYVPKRLLSRYLLDTVVRLLEAVQEQQNRARLMGCLTHSDCTFELENDNYLVRALVGYVQESVSHLGLFDETDKLRVGVALEEALVNALTHGNLEVSSELRAQGDEAFAAMVQQRLGQPPYKDRRIYLTTRLSADDVMFVVRDEGPGFDVSVLPDPTVAENLERASGRGVLLMRSFMDEVRYNDLGNEVTLIKRRAASPTPSS